jgi:hypothetical protein
VGIKTIAVGIAIAIGITIAVLCITNATAKADPTKDMAVMAAFCHDIRQNPTVDGVRTAATETIRIYGGDTNKAADVAYEAVQTVCPDLRSIVIMAINSPNWTGTGGGSVV